MPFPRAFQRSRLVLAAILLAAPVARAQAPAAAPAASPAAPTLATLLAEADAAFAVRDQPGKMDADLAATLKAEKIAPTDYEVLWRLARHHY